MNKRFLLIIGIICLSLIAIITASTFIDYQQSDFNSGTYNWTFYNSSGFIQLNSSRLNGTFTSQVFDVNSTSQWNNISWFTEVPYSQELPSNQQVETGEFLRGANMTWNKGLWHMDDIGGSIEDFSGNGNNGTNYAASYGQEGKINSAMGFDGASGYMTLPSMGGFKTVEMWVKQNARTGFDFYFAHNNFRIYSDQTFGMLKFGDSVGGAITSDVDMDNEGWVHVVAISDGANSKLYANGVFKGSTTLESVSSNTINLGRWITGIHHFNGTMDELAIYNRSLSEEEILDHYKRGALRLNFSIISCDDDECSGESWTNLGNNLTSSQNLSVANNTYFKYKFEFETDNASYSPELYNVSLSYNVLNTAPIVTLNSVTNNSYFSDGENSVLLNATIYDTDLDSMTVWFYGGYANGTYTLINETTGQTNGTEVTYNWPGLNTLGLYNWTVIVNDGTINSTNEYFFFNLINLTVNCEAGGGYQQGGLVLAQGNVSDGTNGLTSHSVNLTVFDASGNMDGSANLTSADDGGFETTFSGLAVGTYTLYANTTYQGFNKTCTDTFVVGSPADLVLDKIVSIQNMTNTTINYNITLRVVNKGGSDTTSTTLTDSDSTSSPYDLTTVSANSTVVRSYIKSYTRNSTTYNSTLVQARVNGTDSYSGNEIEANSSSIVLVIPATTASEQLTLIKNAYYNSENSTAVNYTVSLEVVNSGGVDLSSITVIDTDLDLSTSVNLNRTQNYTNSGVVLVDKAASNTNKLFVKASATVNAVVYQSNQINVRIPGYGGPADAIVYAPASVQTSTSFDTTITVENQNPDIGQDFTIEYWITNVAEDTNYTSGEQTIYVAASGSSDLTATLTSPSSAGSYRYRAIVTWAGGTATAYDSFEVTAPASDDSGDSGSSGGGGSITGKIIYEAKNEEIKSGKTQVLKDGEKIKFNIVQDSIVYSHSLEIMDLQPDRATITIYSQPITILLYVGEEKKLDLDSNGYYDLHIKLEKIENGRASIYFKSLYEEIEKEDAIVENEEGLEIDGEELPSEKPTFLSYTSNKIGKFFEAFFRYIKQNNLYIIIGFGILILFIVIIFLIKIVIKRKPKESKKIKRRPKNKTRLKNTIKKEVYAENGDKIGKVKEVYLKNYKIYGWLIKPDGKIAKKIRKKKILIKHKYVKSIGKIMIIDERISEHLEDC